MSAASPLSFLFFRFPSSPDVHLLFLFVKSPPLDSFTIVFTLKMVFMILVDYFY